MVACGFGLSELVGFYRNQPPPPLPTVISQGREPGPSPRQVVPAPPVPRQIPSGFEPIQAQPFRQGTAWIARQDDRAAPFEVRTSPGFNYYIKLVDVETEKTYARFRVEGGKPFSTTVAPGSYILRYAFGKDWLGPVELFGSATEIYQADELMTFAVSGRRISGRSVELIVQPGGNLSTRSIDRKAF